MEDQHTQGRLNLVDYAQLQPGDIVISLYNPPEGSILTPHNAILTGQLFYHLLTNRKISDAFKCHTAIATETKGIVVEVLPSGPVFTTLNKEKVPRKALVFRLSKSVENHEKIAKDALSIAKFYAALNYNKSENKERQEQNKPLMYAYAAPDAISSILPDSRILSPLKNKIQKLKKQPHFVFCSQFIIRCYQIASSEKSTFQNTLNSKIDGNNIDLLEKKLWSLISNPTQENSTIYTGVHAKNTSPSAQYRYMIDSQQWQTLGVFHHLKNSEKSYLPDGDEFYKMSTYGTPKWYIYPQEFYDLSKLLNSYHKYLKAKKFNIANKILKRIIKDSDTLDSYYATQTSTLWLWLQYKAHRRNAIQKLSVLAIEEKLSNLNIQTID